MEASFLFFLINGWVNNREAGDLRRYRGHYDVIVIDSEAPLGSYLPYCKITMT